MQNKREPSDADETSKKEKPPENPLVTENRALKAKVQQLEAEIRRRDGETARGRLMAKRPQRVLDRNAASSYDRPWDGR